MPECTKCRQPVLVTESSLCGSCDRKVKAIDMAVKYALAVDPDVKYRMAVAARRSKTYRCQGCMVVLCGTYFDYSGMDDSTRDDVCKGCIQKRKHIAMKAKQLAKMRPCESCRRMLPKGNFFTPDALVCGRCTKAINKVKERAKQQELDAIRRAERKAEKKIEKEQKRFKAKQKKLPKAPKPKRKQPQPRHDNKFNIVAANPQYNGMSYASRNLTLTLMGFSGYIKYLNSDLWWDIRTRVMDIKGNRCSLCPAKADQVHHNRYHLEDLLGRNLEHLHPICDDCHEHIEFGPGKVKRHLHEVRAVFFGMLEMNTKSIT